MLRLSFVSCLLLAPTPSYEDARVALSRASAEVLDHELGVAIEMLEGAIADLEAHPERLAQTPEDRGALRVARARLAWLYLASEREDRAAEVMDRALRRANGPLEELETYGPALSELHAARLQRLEDGGRAPIEVDCRVPCHVLVDARPREELAEDLYLGPHTLLITSEDGQTPPRRLELVLEAEGMVVDYGVPSSAAAQPPPPPPPPPPLSPPLAGERMPLVRDRELRPLLPVWAEGAGLAGGLALVVAGAVLLGLEGKCRGDLDGAVDGPDACPKIYENVAAAAPMLGVGAATALGFGVVLGVDRVRARKADGHQLTLGWTMNF